MTQAEPPAYHYLRDLYGQPASLIDSYAGLVEQWPVLLEAGAWLRERPYVFIVGIGSSYNAALALERYLADHGRLVKVIDASELAYAPQLFPAAGYIIASRSGASVEIVRIVQRCQEAGIPIVAVTNAPESPLAQAAHFSIEMRSVFDHQISLRMYTVMVQTLLVLGHTICEAETPFPGETLVQSVTATRDRIRTWQLQIEKNDFFGPGHVYYMLGRGVNLSGAHAARLLMEEAAKTSATVMPTGAFRHGPQESLSRQSHIVIWLPNDVPLRGHDLELAASIEDRGGQCMVIGQGLQARDVAALTIDLPTMPPYLQPIVDIVPVQLGAYVHALCTGKDPDVLIHCPYVVTTEGGL